MNEMGQARMGWDVVERETGIGMSIRANLNM